MAGVVRTRSYSCSTAAIVQPCALARNAGTCRMRSQALHTVSSALAAGPLTPGRERSAQGMRSAEAGACMLRDAHRSCSCSADEARAAEHMTGGPCNVSTWANAARRLQDNSLNELHERWEAQQDRPCRAAAEHAAQGLRGKWKCVRNMWLPPSQPRTSQESAPLETPYQEECVLPGPMRGLGVAEGAQAVLRQAQQRAGRQQSVFEGGPHQDSQRAV